MGVTLNRDGGDGGIGNDWPDTTPGVYLVLDTRVNTDPEGVRHQWQPWKTPKSSLS